MATTSEPTRLLPLIRNALTRHVDYFVETCDSLDPARRRRAIAALRTAVDDSYAMAFRDAVTAGAAPDIAMRDLLTEVHGLEVRLQDLAPRVELAACVEIRLRRYVGEVKQPSPPGELLPASTSVPETIDVASIRPGRGRKRSTHNLHPEVEGFLENVRAAAGKTITIEQFCRVAGFGDDTVFGAWRRGDNKRCSFAQGNSFERTLKLDPVEFLKRLAKIPR